MSIELTTDQARLLRLRGQGLTGDDESRHPISSVVTDCCGLQAQDATQAAYGIWARRHGTSIADIDRARFEEQSIVRTWCMRGTLHYVTTDDLPWLLFLFGPLYISRGQRRLSNLGLGEDDCERAISVIRKLLATDGPLTRDEIANRLINEGLTFDPDGQAPYHIVRRACLEGVAIEAEPRDGEETFALLDEWVSIDSPPGRTEALTELARRYVAAYEPVTLDDLFSWSGWYRRDVRTGWDAIEEELTEVDVAGASGWVISEPDSVKPDVLPIVRLLPMYDSYFLDHHDRELILPNDFAEQVYPGGGKIRASVIVNGVAAGTWKLDRSRATPLVTVEPFAKLDSEVVVGIQSEVESMGRFLGSAIGCVISGSG